MKKWISIICGAFIIANTNVCLAAEETAFVWSNQSNKLDTNTATQAIDTAIKNTSNENVQENSNNALNLSCGRSCIDRAKHRRSII